MLKVISNFPRCASLRFSTKTAQNPTQQQSFMIENDVNGMTVVSINPNVKGLSKVAAVFNAGSRYESYETKGMNHLLRRSAGLACGDITAVSVTRHLQQMGANLRCFGTRETLSYVIDFSHDMLPYVGELLPIMTTRQKFYNWELRDYAAKLMKTDIQYLNRRDFDTLCSELLHKVAFGNGLGNSLFADDYNVGGWNIDHIEGFLDHCITPHKSMLVGISVKHDQLIEMSEKFKIRPLKDYVFESKFRGGEIRRELPLEFSKVALAWETPGFNSMTCALATSLLAYSIDNDVNNRIKWNNGALELIKKVCPDKKVNENCVANSINVSYSDKGLLGFTVTGSPDVMCEAVHELHKHFSGIGKSGVAQPDFEIAKTMLVHDLLMKADTSDGSLEHVISQATGSEGIVPIEALVAQAKSISLEEVNKVAKSVLASNKKAMVAIGDLSSVPYLSDLH